MTYTKNTWVDQEGQVRYTETEDDGYKIFTANYEEVTQLGTPVNADNMNHIEDGIEECFGYVDDEVATAKDYALNLLKAIYPIGSIYIGTQNDCPLSSLFGTWEKVAGDKVLQTSSSNHNANTTIAAGLPNIKGAFRLQGTEGSSDVSGAFTAGAKGGSWGEGHGNAAVNPLMSFNASRSSSIYKDNFSTVQPPAYVVNVWRRTA